MLSDCGTFGAFLHRFPKSILYGNFVHCIFIVEKNTILSGMAVRDLNVYPERQAHILSPALY